MSRFKLGWRRRRARPVPSRPTELELRLEARIAEEIKPERVYVENWATCRHERYRRLAELGSVHLEECEGCGQVVGVAR